MLRSPPIKPGCLSRNDWAAMRELHDLSPEGRRERLHIIFADVAFALADRFDEALSVSILEALEGETKFFLGYLGSELGSELLELAGKGLALDIVEKDGCGPTHEVIARGWKACLRRWRERDVAALAMGIPTELYVLCQIRQAEKNGGLVSSL